MTTLIVLALATHRMLQVWFLQPIARRPRLLLARLPKIGYVEGCEFCMSFWLGVVMVGCWQWTPTRLLVWALAASQAATVLSIVWNLLTATVSRVTRTA